MVVVFSTAGDYTLKNYVHDHGDHNPLHTVSMAVAMQTYQRKRGMLVSGGHLPMCYRVQIHTE